MNNGSWFRMAQMDELARLDSPIHRLDARFKIGTSLIFTVMVMSFSPYEISALLPFFLYPVLLMRIAKIPWAVVGLKLLVALPFALVVGLFNPIIDRQPVVIYPDIEIARGWISLLSIVLRFVLTAGTALILIASTGMNQISQALEQLKIPRMFTLQLLFLYRYLSVVASEGSNMLRAFRLRAGSHTPSIGVYSSLVGHLLTRSMSRAERIFQAMQARGFEGQMHMLPRNKTGANDFFFGLAWMLFFAVARMYNLSAVLGSLRLGSIP